MRAITLDQAVKIINGAFAEAKRRNAYPLTAVLLDAGGRMKAALKQDGASLLRFEVSYGKAYAALAMGLFAGGVTHFLCKRGFDKGGLFIEGAVVRGDFHDEVSARGPPPGD